MPVASIFYAPTSQVCASYARSILHLAANSCFLTGAVPTGGMSSDDDRTMERFIYYTGGNGKNNLYRVFSGRQVLTRA